MKTNKFIDCSILFWILLVTLLYFFYRVTDILTLLGVI